MEIKIAESVRCGAGRLTVELAAVCLGRDVVIMVSGGQAHVGAVVMAVPRPSLEDPRRVSATASVLTATGHKEDELLRPIALRAAAALNSRVVAVGGVHLDGATGEEIARLMENCMEGTELLLARLKERLSPVSEAETGPH
ncbi:MAG: hypothetical protein ACPL5F_04255 [Moorellaceae bacterium]